MKPGSAHSSSSHGKLRSRLCKSCHKPIVGQSWRIRVACRTMAQLIHLLNVSVFQPLLTGDKIYEVEHGSNDRVLESSRLGQLNPTEYRPHRSVLHNILVATMFATQIYDDMPNPVLPVSPITINLRASRQRWIPV